MNYLIQDIANILSQDSISLKKSEVQGFFVDTRQITVPKSALFFALPGTMNDGHDFLDAAYAKGVRNFVVSREVEKKEDANYLKVNDVLFALQTLATHHRQKFPELRTIAITGSNGKTIVKEWLYQMLQDQFKIVKSPKSYNSQIGMALSILNIDSSHELGIFEAGISKKNEMIRHYEMLQPEIGLITNIGSAHDEGFHDHQEKAKEKMKLFKSSEVIIHSDSDKIVREEGLENYSEIPKFVWGRKQQSKVRILESEIKGNRRHLTILYKEDKVNLIFRFVDAVALENIMQCLSVLLYLGVPLSELQQRINRISAMHMRLEMTSGIEGSILINDAYSADLDSLKMALEFTQLHAPQRERIAILSSFEQSGMSEEHVFSQILDEVHHWGFTRLVYISTNQFNNTREGLDIKFFNSKDAFIEEVVHWNFRNKAILIKGSRKAALEEISEKLTEKGHSAMLSINLNNLESNIRVYKNLLKPSTGIIAVIKASAYGSGSNEVAQILERNGVDYLAVAFADEGVTLRKAGIISPIMILNPDMVSIKDIIQYDLEPEIYNIQQLQDIDTYCKEADVVLPLHLKLDTGMHRLGFLENEIDALVRAIKYSQNVRLATIFSHLASSEDENEDFYSEKQLQKFDRISLDIQQKCAPTSKRHILNSAGISRFSNFQFDYVRLGIGMYGIDGNANISKQLKMVHGLSARIIQLKDLKAGDSVGYNRKTILDKDTKIAIVNIGYADGLMRNLGNRNYSFLVNGSSCSILGNVCMDLTIIDVTNTKDVRIGNNVVIFDSNHSIERLSRAAHTIPYEILSRISNRVQRKFIRE